MILIRSAAEMRHAKHYMNVLSAANGLYEKGGESALAGLRLLDLDWKNIQFGQGRAEQRSQVADDVGASDDASMEMALLLCNEYPQCRIPSAAGLCDSILERGFIG